MKTFYSSSFRIFSAVFLLSATLFGQDITLKLSGLQKPVVVYRDSRSIPYIYADNDDDLYFAQGFVTASDRLWQMDLLRRVARGETAEIFGSVALEEDRRWRRYGFAEIAKKNFALLPAEIQRSLRRYAEGVNAFISRLDERSLPVEFRILQYRPRDWAVEDTIVIGKILADALSTTWRSDLLNAALQTLPKEKYRDLMNVKSQFDVILFGSDLSDRSDSQNPKIISPKSAEKIFEAAAAEYMIRERSLHRLGIYAEDLAASNNWVIAGKRTADGKSILANDPHLRPSAPGIWYLVALKSPNVNVAGVTVPGAPGVILGHNQRIAWGATNVGPDVQDIYVENCDTDGKCKGPDGIEQSVRRIEKIRVRKTAGSSDFEVIDFPVIETRNGVVVLEENGKTYSLKWTARDPKNDELSAFFILNRAGNWEEFKKALSSYRGPTQNFVYADTDGNIGWQVAGAIPIRRKGDGSLPYDGATTEGDWIGTIPIKELPVLFNPPSGFIVTANQRIVGTDYKYPQLVRQFAAPWRARRLFDLLSAEKRATIESVRAAQYDVYNIPLANLAKALVAVNALPADIVRKLKSWDGRMTADSSAALIVNEIAGCLSTEIADSSRPAPASLIRERILDSALRSENPIWLPAKYKSYSEFLAACGNSALDNLQKRFGEDQTKWVWGAEWTSTFPHPLASVPFIGARFATPKDAIAGSGQTPNVGSSVSMRLITVPGKWDATNQVIPLGQSGDPGSPHYQDQFELWKSGKPAVFPFSEGAVKRAAVSITSLVP